MVAAQESGVCGCQQPSQLTAPLAPRSALGLAYEHPQATQTIHHQMLLLLSQDWQLAGPQGCSDSTPGQRLHGALPVQRPGHGKRSEAPAGLCLRALHLQLWAAVAELAGPSRRPA